MNATIADGQDTTRYDGGQRMSDLKPCPFCGTPYPYITFEHGYIDDMSILLKPPFDRPMPFVRLYSPEDQKRIISIVNDINENATKLVGY